MTASQLDPANADYDHTVLAGDHWMREIARGQTFRITDLEGNQAADTLFYNAHDPADRYSASDTIQRQRNLYLTTGTQLISTDHYAEFIAPHDDAILSRYPRGGMIHLCGTHTQHIPVWKQMPSLRAIQVNDRAAADLELYLREMPERIYYVHPCEGMPVERTEELAKTHKIVICAEPPQRHR